MHVCIKADVMFDYSLYSSYSYTVFIVFGVNTKFTSFRLLKSCFWREMFIQYIRRHWFNHSTSVVPGLLKVQKKQESLPKQHDHSWHVALVSLWKYRFYQRIALWKYRSADYKVCLQTSRLFTNEVKTMPQYIRAVYILYSLILTYWCQK